MGLVTSGATGLLTFSGRLSTAGVTFFCSLSSSASTISGNPGESIRGSTKGGDDLGGVESGEDDMVSLRCARDCLAGDISVLGLDF